MIMEKNYRGKGHSETKFCKGTNTPKHAGNFSYATIHAQSLQSKDYRVTEKDGELIVGNETPLSAIFTPSLVVCIKTDEHFESYTQIGFKLFGNKQYESKRILTKYQGRFNYLQDIKYILREQVYTDNEFTYNFPNY